MPAITISLEAASASTTPLQDLPYNISNSGDTRIVRDERGTIMLEPHSQPQSSQDSGQFLGLITTDGYHISFEAQVDGFAIVPPGSESLPHYRSISLPVSTDQHRWSTMLRPDDSIRFSDGTSQFDFTVRIEDDVKVTSSIQQEHESTDDEVPETQERSAMSAPDISHRRAERPTAKRTAVQVEQSMQGSNTLRSTPPSRPTQQSLIVEETPATNRKMALAPRENSSMDPQDTVDPKELISTDVTTPTAIRDSFAERPKHISTSQIQQTIPSLELGSFGRSDVDADEQTTASGDEKDEDHQTENPVRISGLKAQHMMRSPAPNSSRLLNVGEERRTIASEDEDEDEDRQTENPDFSTAPEGDKPRNAEMDATLKATPVVSEISASHLQATDEMEGAITSPTGEETSLSEASEAEDTPKARPKRGLRAKPQPEVRIPPSRSKKRASPEEASPARPTKKSRKSKAQEQAQSQDHLASSIRVRVDRTPPMSGAPVSSAGKLEAVSEKSTPAPTASQSSHRSASSSIQLQTLYRGNPPCVAFSNTSISERQGTSNWLARQGVRTAEKVTEKGCDLVCIGLSNGTYVKSAKLLLGLALGKPIVSDHWVLQSRQAKKLLAPSNFPPLKAPDEWHWGDNEKDVNSVLNLDRSGLFKGKVFFVTPALKKEYGGGYSDLEKIVKAAGAKIMSKAARDYKHAGNNVILASENSDLESMALMGTDRDDGYQCYTKDLVSMSIIRGSLDLESDEFKIKPISSQTRKGKGATGKKRKSDS